MMATIAPAFADIMPGPYLSDWLIGFAGASLLWLVVWSKSKRAKKFRRDAEYGTARWGAL
jgi:type IV secretion system protein VirD4